MGWLKEARGIATRYEKLAAHYLALLKLAIMRRLLKQIAAGAEVKGDTTTLEDLSVLTRLSQTEE